jgi:hypothetical protein
MEKNLTDLLRGSNPFDNLGESPDGNSKTGGSIGSRKFKKRLATVEEV